MPFSKTNKIAFGHSDSKSLIAFKLIHVDIWGPYGIKSLLGEKNTLLPLWMITQEPLELS